MANVITLRMLTSNPGSQGNLPSQFIPGAGAGRGSFKIDHPAHNYPSHRILAHALDKWDSGSILNEYDESTGRGRFVVVDGYVPEAGSVLELVDTITPCEGSELTLTLGAEGIAALECYREARELFRKTGPSNRDEWSLRLEACQREGAQLAGWVLEATQPQPI